MVMRGFRALGSNLGLASLMLMLRSTSTADVDARCPSVHSFFLSMLVTSRLRIFFNIAVVSPIERLIAQAAESMLQQGPPGFGLHGFDREQYVHGLARS